MTKRAQHMAIGLAALLAASLVALSGCGPQRPEDGAFWPMRTPSPAVVTPVVPPTPETSLASLASDQQPLTATLVFNHASVFALGSHDVLPCESCHAGATGSQADCESCHQRPAQHVAGADSSCYLCHASSGWKPAAYPHAGGKSLGAHTDGFVCGACHESRDLRAASARCQPCHDRPAVHPPVGPGDCARCHEPNGWKPADYQHKAFVSLGKHTGAVCAVCHTDGTFTGSTVPCQVCHTTPAGHAPGITEGCQRCHQPGSFRPAQVQHAGFPLTGKHVAVGCTQCHADAVYAGRPENCSSCHSKPAGHLAGAPQTCETCHTTSGWSAVRYKHVNFTLVGAHQTAACAACHADGRFAGRSADCASCHSVPGGHLPGINGGCQRCHSPAGWRPVQVDHAAWRLVGRHAEIACASCHSDGGYSGKSSACASCHSKPAGHLPTSLDCSQCHTPNGWKPANFKHTNFLLIGAHQTVACASCHADGRYAGRPSTCESCHSTPPGHIPGITSGCSQCHSPTGWKPASFNHTKFSLTGGHAGVPCASCHANGQYAGRSSACESCHTQPAGHLPGLTTGCNRCHSPAGWEPANVNHTKWPLTGLHQSVGCIRCHGDGRYSGRPSTCESCHTTPAGHIPGITSGCSQCHATSGWKPANFNHTKFALTGGHSGVPCASCHANGQYAGRSAACESCHTQPAGHLPGLTTGCSLCHSPSGWKPATVNHTKWPLVGLHQTVACIKCHADGRYAGRPNTCESCHRTPAGHIGGITSGCSQCHSPTGWKPATFNHSKFPLTNKHAGVACASCHKTGVYAGTSPLCQSCHTPPSTHTGMSNLNCASCHNTLGFKPSTFVHKPVGEHIGTNPEYPLACTKCHPTRFTERTCVQSGCHRTMP